MDFDEKNARFVGRIAAGNKLTGTWSYFANFPSVELMAHVGFDFVILDMQHGELGPSHFPALLSAFKGTPTIPIVRVAKNDYHSINWLYDQGAPVVMVPLVNGPADAQRAVDAAKYPPLGKRSFGPFRCTRYGLDLPQYMTESDDRATLIVQVEDAKAARGIDEILAVPGIDAVFLGPNDIAFSLLGPGERLSFEPGPDGKSKWSTAARTPEVLALCDHVMRRCAAAGKPFGLTSASMEDLRAWQDKGADFVTFGTDFTFLRTGVQMSTGLKPHK